MAMIKIAHEIALERTKDMKADETAIHLNDVKTNARKTAGKYLDDPDSVDLAKAIKAMPAEDREVFRKAVFDVFMGLVQLPTTTFDSEKLATIGKGLGIVAGFAQGAGSEKKAMALVQQISAFISKYLDELKRVDQAIRNQWAPRFKEQERQLALQTGRQVRVDPMTDPQFVEFYKKNVEALQQSYGDALEKAKQDLAAICGFADANE
jgi:hypothetical protein